MPVAVNYLLCALLGYAIGTVNPAYLIAKLKGFDIREKGSGNAGASNAIITMGKAVGALSALFDIAKACFAVWLGRTLFPWLTCAAEIAGASSVIGHIFPATMGFRGGKGFACMSGVVLTYDIRVFGIMLAAAILLALVTDYICFVPLTGSLAFPIVYYFQDGGFAGTLIYAALFPIVLYKHWENLRRIRQGREMRFSFLWNKDRELARLTSNRESDTHEE